MENTNNKTWLEQYVENYRGRSEEAKELENLVKKTYQGAKYIPWATMERLTYMQDPDAVFEKVKNEDGSLVFSRYDTVSTYQHVGKTSGEKQEIQTTETKSQNVAHFVRVRVTFLGKTIEEDYPIQDSKYAAVRVFDANAINKSLQRALAKAASRATGLGISLYEFGDLQFED